MSRQEVHWVRNSDLNIEQLHDSVMHLDQMIIQALFDLLVAV